MNTLDHPLMGILLDNIYLHKDRADCFESAEVGDFECDRTVIDRRVLVSRHVRCAGISVIDGFIKDSITVEVPGECDNITGIRIV